MTKVVIPTRDQPFVTDELANEPWRRHLDISNEHLNRASQLISVVPVTAGSTRYVLNVPSGWRKLNLNVYGLVPATTGASVAVRVSTAVDTDSVAAGYRLVKQEINDSTATSIVGSTAATLWNIAAAPLSTVSSGGVSLSMSLMALSTPQVYMTFRGVYLDGASTENLVFTDGAGSVGISQPIKALAVRTAAGSYSTGTIALYGER